MAVKFISARIDERGKISGGKAGNQTGKELDIQNWYLHTKKWWVVRAKDPAVGVVIAEAAKAAKANMLIGYDQSQRDTLWNALKSLGFDVSALEKAVETDCSALARFCVAAAGIIAANFNTATAVSALLATGAFVQLTDKKYTDQSAYLRKGDMLVTRKKGHMGIIANDGPKAYAGADVPLGTRPLSKGSDGGDVDQLQEALARLGFDPKGIDGEFGPKTETAVKAYQKARKLPVTGKADDATIKAILADIGAKVDPDEPGEEPEPQGETQTIRVIGGEVNVRSGPGTEYDAVTTRRKGDVLTALITEGWRLVLVNGNLRWVSARPDLTEVVL